MISIIIVNYNTGKCLIECVESIYRFENHLQFEIIIVDNNSIDDSKKIILSLINCYNNIESIFLTQNKGFAFANNRGVETAKGEYILILNPDIIFRDAILNKIKVYYNKNNAGAVGVSLKNKSDEFQYEYYQKLPSIKQYIFFYSVLSGFFSSEKRKKKYLYDSNAWENNTETEVTALPGAFVFMNKEIFQNAGGFRENYFLFYEDVNLSYDINKKYKITLLKTESVTHLGGSSMLDENQDKYSLYIISFYKFFKLNYKPYRKNILKIIIIINSYIKIFIEKLRQMTGKGNQRIIDIHKNIMNNLK